jgi:hypothetical protein
MRRSRDTRGTRWTQASKSLCRVTESIGFLARPSTVPLLFILLPCAGTAWALLPTSSSSRCQFWSLPHVSFLKRFIILFFTKKYICSGIYILLHFPPLKRCKERVWLLWFLSCFQCRCVGTYNLLPLPAASSSETKHCNKYCILNMKAVLAAVFCFSCSHVANSSHSTACTHSLRTNISKCEMVLYPYE